MLSLQISKSFSHLKCTEKLDFAGLPEMTETEEFELLLIHKSTWRQALSQIFWALKKKTPQTNQVLLPVPILQKDENILGRKKIN